VDASIRKEMIQPSHLLFAVSGEQRQLIEQIDEVQQEVGVFQSNPTYNTPEKLLQEVKQIILGKAKL